jgi:hypothetical protein
LTATVFVTAWDPLLPNDEGPKQLQGNDVEAVSNLFGWASKLALPSSAFAVDYDDNAEITDGMSSFTPENRARLISPQISKKPKKNPA